MSPVLLLQEVCISTDGTERLKSVAEKLGLDNIYLQRMKDRRVVSGVGRAERLAGIIDWYN